jgi:hypothetical protein
LSAPIAQGNLVRRDAAQAQAQLAAGTTDVANNEYCELVETRPPTPTILREDNLGANMYPLDAVYGSRAYRAFYRDNAFRRNLKRTLQSSKQVATGKPLSAKSYTELVEIVSFLSIMNKRTSLYFRGQTQDWPLRPATFRPVWTSLSGTRHSIPDGRATLREIWSHLNEQISPIVTGVCEKLPMPRPATLKMFREAVWAIAQHYELWPTPLIDVSPNLRVAASFALWGEQPKGYLYVVALPASTNSVTFDADQHVVLARLHAVCPPVAKRPHYQDGFLTGRFPFKTPVTNEIDRDPANVSDLARRLVARIVLIDKANAKSRGQSERGFWSDDFPRMSATSLMPNPKDDLLLSAFSQHASRIDEAMSRICRRHG